MQDEKIKEMQLKVNKLLETHTVKDKSTGEVIIIPNVLPQDITHLFQEYGNYIRQQTLEEAEKCVPEEGKNCTFSSLKMNDSGIGGWDFCRQQTLSNLQALKDKNK